jgi:hypothetical protein
VVPTSGNPAPKKKANPGSGGDALGDDAQDMERKLRLDFAGTLAKCLSDANLRHDREAAKRVVESDKLAARAAEAHCKEVRELHEAIDQFVAHSNAEKRSLLNKNILLIAELSLSKEGSAGVTNRLAAAEAAVVLLKDRSENLEAVSADLAAQLEATRANAVTASEMLALAAVQKAAIGKDLAQARSLIEVQKRVIAGRDQHVQRRLEHGLDLLQKAASDSNRGVEVYLEETGKPKEESAPALLEKARGQGQDAAFLLDLIRSLLRRASYHAKTRRIVAAIGRGVGIRLFYNTPKDGGDYVYPEHSKEELEVSRDRREAKLATQVLFVADTFISARTGGRKIGFIGFLLAMCFTAVGGLSQLGQSFASAASVMAGQQTCYKWAQSVRAKWWAFYITYFIMHVTIDGIVFVFDNYALLEFAKTPDGAVTCRSAGYVEFFSTIDSEGSWSRGPIVLAVTRNGIEKWC